MVVRRRVDGCWASKIIEDIIPPPFSSQIKKVCYFTSYCCLLMVYEGNEAAQRRASGREKVVFMSKWTQSPELPGILKSEWIDVERPPQDGRCGAGAGLRSEYRDSFWIYMIKLCIPSKYSLCFCLLDHLCYLFKEYFLDTQGMNIGKVALFWSYCY